MYEVVFASKRVGKTLDRLPAKQKQQIVHDIENKLRTLNFLTKGVKHLRAMNLYRLRCGDFRVLYRIEGKRITVVMVSDRKDVPY